ncbi:MAG: hypothetical protein ACTHJ3_14200 [Pararhizobium sp.]
MGRFFQFFGRLVVIAIGFSIAAFVASATLVLLNGAMVPGELARLHDRGLDVRLVVGVLGLGGLIAHASFLPALVLIAIGELARRRDWLAYALGGGLVAIAVVALAYRGGVALAFDAGHVAVDVVGGLLAGTAYWIVAGHGAGRWLPSESRRDVSVSAPE